MPRKTILLFIAIVACVCSEALADEIIYFPAYYDQISSSTPLADGIDYFITISGTWSAWPAAEIFDGPCGLPAVWTEWGWTILDAEFHFNGGRIGESCPGDPPYPCHLYPSIRFDITGDGFVDVEPIAGLVCSPEHTYDYAVTGRGKIIKIWHNDTGYDDNYGGFLVSIRLAEAVSVQAGTWGMIKSLYE